MTSDKKIIVFALYTVFFKDLNDLTEYLRKSRQG